MIPPTALSGAARFAATAAVANTIAKTPAPTPSNSALEEVRERVRALAGQRVDALKVLATGAVLTHNSNANAREATYEELVAAVEEGRNYGLKVAAHAHSPGGIRNAVRAGVASIDPPPSPECSPSAPTAR